MTIGHYQQKLASIMINFERFQDLEDNDSHKDKEDFQLLRDVWSDNKIDEPDVH